MSPSFKLVLSRSRAQRMGTMGTCTHGDDPQDTSLFCILLRGKHTKLTQCLIWCFHVFPKYFPMWSNGRTVATKTDAGFWCTMSILKIQDRQSGSTGCFAEQDITGPRGDKCPFDLTTLRLPSGVRDPSWFAVAKFDLSKGSSVDLQHFSRGCNSFQTIHPGTSHAPTRIQKMGISGS